MWTQYEKMRKVAVHDAHTRYSARDILVKRPEPVRNSIIRKIVISGKQTTLGDLIDRFLERRFGERIAK